MEKRSYGSKVKSYLQLNWFKLTLLAMLVFVFLRKDLSFQFNINSPNQVEQSQPASEEQLPLMEEQEKKGELLTQKAPPKTKTSNTSLLSALNLPSFGTGAVEDAAQAEMAQIDQATKEKYLRRFGHVAISESKKYGIPASIILANAAVHSYFGLRDMAHEGNNHFGIPCTSKWQGESSTYNDACYRHYENAWSSFRDHSLYLTSGRFAQLREIPVEEYRSWAEGLQRLTYSDLYDDLAGRLIEVIEASDLYALDL